MSDRKPNPWAAALLELAMSRGWPRQKNRDAIDVTFNDDKTDMAVHVMSVGTFVHISHFISTPSEPITANTLAKLLAGELREMADMIEGCPPFARTDPAGYTG